MESAAPARVYTNGFWLMAASSFLFFSSFNMLIPELPGFITSLGGADYKGYIIALFTLTAGLSRPFSGRLTDTIGRVPVMAVGSLVCFVLGFLYPWVAVVPHAVGAFLLLRLLHGFSTGFKPTATSAYVADMVPPERRGEAMGLLSVFGSIGMAAGPALGSYVAKWFGLNALFYGSSLLALLSIVIIAQLPETLPYEKQRFRWSLLKLSRRDIFEPDVLAPSTVVFLNAVGFGAIVTIIPDFGEHLGIHNKGLFYTVFTLASLGVRLVAGRVSDQYGRTGVLQVASVIITVSLVLLATATTLWQFVVAGVVFGIGTGINSPTVAAWTTDLSHEHNRGRALATMYITMEAGIGLGAWLSAALYANIAANFGLAFGVMAAFSAVAWIFLLLYTYRKRNS